MNWLNRMRRAPREAKSRYALVTASAVTLLIGGIWSTSLPARFADLTDLTDSGPAEEIVPESQGALSDLFESASEQLGNAIEPILEEVPADEGSVDYDALNDDIEAQLEAARLRGQGFAPSKLPDEDNIATPAQVDQDKQIKSSAPRVILIATTTNQMGE